MIKFISILLTLGFTTIAIASDKFVLPEPDKTNMTSLIQALNERASLKNFSDKDVDNKTLSTILWAAYGVNRPNGLRTIPTALNQKDLKIYVFKKDGIWLYNAEENAIHPISEIDYRSIFQTQDYMKDVPVILLYTGENKDYASLHAGSAYQNVNLFATANNMSAVVRGYFDKEAVQKVLGLTEDEHIIISQAIGWRK